MEFMSNVIIFLAIHQEMQFVLYTIYFAYCIKHVLSSTGIDAPLFSYFPVCIYHVSERE